MPDSAAPANKFCLTRAEDGAFETMTGYRDWLKSRHLGLKEATDGAYNAWITRANEMGGSTGRHYHDYDFQIMYVLKGWVKVYYEGEGEIVMKAGDFVYHPKGHVHDLMDYSEDIEIFELASPGTQSCVDV